MICNKRWSDGKWKICKVHQKDNDAVTKQWLIREKKRELDQCVDKARIQRTKVNNLYLKRVIFFTLWSSVIMTRKGFNRRLRHQMHFQKRPGATQSLNGVKAGGGKLFDWSNCRRTRIKLESKEIWLQKSCRFIWIAESRNNGFCCKLQQDISPKYIIYFFQAISLPEVTGLRALCPTACRAPHM